MNTKSMKPLEAKAYKRITSIVDRRSKSEHRWLFEKFKLQREVWEDYIEKCKYLNPFDDEHAQKREKAVYYEHLINFGNKKFKELGLL